MGATAFLSVCLFAFFHKGLTNPPPNELSSRLIINLTNSVTEWFTSHQTEDWGGCPPTLLAKSFSNQLTNKPGDQLIDSRAKSPTDKLIDKQTD